LLVAPFTPFDDQGNFNESVFPKYTQHIHKSGVRGVFANGTTGEALSLTLEERKIGAEKWIDSKLFDVVIVHVGALCINDAKELARHAEKHGATGIAALPPFYYKAPTIEDLVEYYRELSSAAPKTPILLYHFPGMTGVNIPLSKFLTLAAKEIPQFCGAKFTSEDSRELSLCQSIPNIKIFTGYDEVLLPGLPLGITAAVGASYNFMAPISLRILKAYHDGKIEEAWRLQRTVLHASQAIVKHGVAIAALKATMNLVVRDFSVGPTRSPLLFKAHQVEALKKDLAALDRSEWHVLS